MPQNSKNRIFHLQISKIFPKHGKKGVDLSVFSYSQPPSLLISTLRRQNREGTARMLWLEEFSDCSPLSLLVPISTFRRQNGREGALPFGLGLWFTFLKNQWSSHRLGGHKALLTHNTHTQERALVSHVSVTVSSTLFHTTIVGSATLRHITCNQ